MSAISLGPAFRDFVEWIGAGFIFPSSRLRHRLRKYDNTVTTEQQVLIGVADAEKIVRQIKT